MAPRLLRGLRMSMPEENSPAGHEAGKLSNFECGKVLVSNVVESDAVYAVECLQSVVKDESGVKTTDKRENLETVPSSNDEQLWLNGKEYKSDCESSESHHEHFDTDPILNNSESDSLLKKSPALKKPRLVYLQESKWRRAGYSGDKFKTYRLALRRFKTSSNLTPIAERKTSSHSSSESESRKLETTSTLKICGISSLLTNATKMSSKRGVSYTGQAGKGNMGNGRFKMPEGKGYSSQYKVKFQVESDSDEVGDAENDNSMKNETSGSHDLKDGKHNRGKPHKEIISALNGRQRKFGRSGDQLDESAKHPRTLTRKISTVGALHSIPNPRRRRNLISVLSIPAEATYPQKVDDDCVKNKQEVNIESHRGTSVDSPFYIKDRRQSNSSKQAVYGTSRASISNLSDKQALVLCQDNTNDEDGENFAIGLLGRRSSLTSKIRAWKTVTAEKLNQDEPPPGVRHSASLPALMSYQPRSNQRQLQHQLQSQQQQQQQQLPQRRTRRRSSLIPNQSRGSFTAMRLNKRNQDSYSMSGPGLRRMLRKTLSQGDFTKMSAYKNFMPLVKFRRAVKMILLLQRATYNSRERNQRRERNFGLWASVLGGSFTTSRRAYEMYGISFDPQDFKANREIQVSAEAKAILSLEPSQRTPHQLHLVLMSLRQAVKEFSEFPINMQESLARVGWYEHFEAKRVIIRQGHNAENFYFILSGTAVVIVLDTDKQSGETMPRTAAFLGKGKSFGELALMHKSRRTATVTCRDDVELLAVGREDFIDIFMHVEKNIEPEHVRFLRTLNILRDWPLADLPVDNPKILLFTYVRRGVLLCKDSNNSEWIYVVKSGSCNVIKALRSTNGHYGHWDKKALTSSLNSIRALEHLESNSRTIPATASLPRISNKDNKENGQETLRPQKYRRSSRQRRTTVSLALFRDPSEIERSALEHMQTLDAIMEQRHAVLTQEENPVEQTEESSDQVSPYNHMESKSDGTNNTVFVEILKLAPRDVYGLESCVFKSLNKTTSTSLVSGGAELIMINRKFFLDHTSEQLRKQIRREIRPLPSEETLQAQLETEISWEAFRHLTLKDAVHSSRRHSRSCID